ncbi:LytR/AlgR family response regulator transcription factor [Mesoterricola silvestris]|uniref:DNA-binding response regulator n=1 Tax=Mesoterricola silvestris TaxID=2927979 RepID=A0AA48HA17_9BACT|nr:LytTR family DNA-binding domain-containing protein [Mesoterricola silvestris]BDU74508.1 DNA-binding response regulator [Mesoterricola silvestris]
MSRVRAVIVDDEPLICGELKTLLEAQEWAWVVGVYHDGARALAFLEEEGADLVFLDIQMPEMGGLELAARLAALPRPPRVVFVTAYAQHALEAFKVQAMDYLLKPFDAADLLRIRDRMAGAGRAPAEAPRFPRTILVEGASGLDVVPVDRIRMIVAREREVFLETLDGRSRPTRTRLTEYEARLDPAFFLRCHRNYIVNVDQVQNLTPWFNHAYLIHLKPLRDGVVAEIPVGRMYLPRLKSVFGL